MYRWIINKQVSITESRETKSALTWLKICIDSLQITAVIKNSVFEKQGKKGTLNSY